MIGRSAPAAALHELDNDGGVAGDMLAQEWHHAFYPHAGGAAGVVVYDLDGLALKKGRLRKTHRRRNGAEQQCNNEPHRRRPSRAHGHLLTHATHPSNIVTLWANVCG